MSPTPSVAGEFVRELIAKFPDAPALTLAKKAYREQPKLFRSVEACRTIVRYYLGVIGKRNRNNQSNRTQLRREPRKAGWYQLLPDAKPHFDEPWGAVQYDGPCRVLVLSDIHIPYHDKGAVELAIEYGIKNRADFVLLNGDIVDNFALSRWEKDPRKRDFAGEIRDAKLFLKSVRAAFPKARLVWKEGNHELRYERFLQLKAPDLLGLPCFEWSELLGLNEIDAQYVKDNRPVRLGELNVIHGHEYRNGLVTNPVNPARGLFLRAKIHALCGHWHQSSSHSGRTMEQKVVTTWSTGCLCDMHPEYLVMNEWSLGFAFVSIDADGAFEVKNLRIIDGKIY